MSKSHMSEVKTSENRQDRAKRSGMLQVKGDEVSSNLKYVGRVYTSMNSFETDGELTIQMEMCNGVLRQQCLVTQEKGEEQ